MGPRWLAENHAWFDLHPLTQDDSYTIIKANVSKTVEYDINYLLVAMSVSLLRNKLFRQTDIWSVCYIQRWSAWHTHCAFYFRNQLISSLINVDNKRNYFITDNNNSICRTANHIKINPNYPEFSSEKHRFSIRGTSAEKRLCRTAY
jgi:hypothetical protein